MFFAELSSEAGWLAGWLAGGLVGCLAGWWAGWLVSWLAGWLAGWLAAWLAGWLPGGLLGWQTWKERVSGSKLQSGNLLTGGRLPLGGVRCSRIIYGVTLRNFEKVICHAKDKAEWERTFGLAPRVRSCPGGFACGRTFAFGWCYVLKRASLTQISTIAFEIRRHWSFAMF